MTCDPKHGCPPDTHNLHCGYPNCEKGRADGLDWESVQRRGPEQARRAALYDDLVAALEDIERGYPAGSPSSTLMTDGCWREFARELQRMARAVLSRAREKQP